MSSTVKFKNPGAPATAKQLAFYNALAAEHGLPAVATFAEGTTVKDASEAIDALKGLPKGMQIPEPKQSLTDMAAAIAGGKPAPAAVEDDLEAQPALMLAFTREECKAIRGALSVSICETDGSPAEHVLMAKVEAFLKDEPQPAVVDLPHYIGGGSVTVGV